MKKELILLLGVFLVGCPGAKDPADEKITPAENTYYCKSGCENLEKLNCTDIIQEFNEETGSCEEACKYIIESGSNLGVEDWKDYTSCDQF